MEIFYFLFLRVYLDVIVKFIFTFVLLLINTNIPILVATNKLTIYQYMYQ